MAFQFVHSDGIAGACFKRVSKDGKACEAMMVMKNAPDDTNMDHDYLNRRLLQAGIDSDGFAFIANQQRGCIEIFTSKGHDFVECKRDEFIEIAERAFKIVSEEWRHKGWVDVLDQSFQRVQTAEA